MFLTFGLLVLAGVAAGALTTIASLGGGILVIALMSLFWPPATVLGVTAPALFVGNASRVAMLFREVDWAVAARFALTGVPTALGASLVAASLPQSLLKIVVAAFLFVFVARELGVGRKRDLAGNKQAAQEPVHAVQVPVEDAQEPVQAVQVPVQAVQVPVQAVRVPNGAPHELNKAGEGPERAATPWLASVGGAIAGAVSGLAGGAGFVASPFLHSLGLSPKALVATSAACMALIHLTKGAGFTLANVLTPALLPLSVALAVGIVAGNALGTRVLVRMSRETFRRVLVGAVALAGVQLVLSTVF